MNNPLISVIVPVYNTAEFLPECIDSILHQTYRNFELILVDDGSTDESLSICKQYSETDKRIKVAHQDNQGVSAARNVGLDTATGSYIMFVDSDDSIVPDCLEVLLKSLLFHHADIASGMSVNSSYLWNSEPDYVVWKNTTALEESLKDNPFLYAIWSKLYRADLIGETRFRKEFRINEDTLFVFELLCKQPTFVCLKNELYYYRHNPGSASNSSFSEKYFDILKVSEEKHSIIKITFPALIPLAENMRIKAKMNILRLLAVRTKGEYSYMEKRLKRDIIKNARYYQSGIPADDRWMFIIRHHLYPFYAMMKRRGIR